MKQVLVSARDDTCCRMAADDVDVDANASEGSSMLSSREEEEAIGD